MSLNLYTNQQLMNKEMKKKFTKTFDLSQIAEDPMDSYLDTLGLWKKRIARDGSCLFRAVAEQIYPCQIHHDRVRQECVRYMSDHKEEFSKFVTNISFEEYLEAMKNPLEYAGQLEIAAMSKLYNRDFIIYQHPDQSGIDVTLNGYEKKIYLCYSYNNHFDAIFTKTHRDCLALIQSFVYEILYDKVFGSGEQVSVARKLLRKSDTIYPKEYMKGSQYEYDDDESDQDINNDLEDSDDSIERIDFDDDNQHSIMMTDEMNASNALEGTITQQLEETTLENNVDQNNNEIKVNDKLKTKKDETYQINTISNSLTSNYNNDKSTIQKMPLPYKVAKSLDPVIYRNTAFDAWQAAKKEYEEVVNQKAISILQTGDKCLVKLNNNYSEKWNLAYVQNIQQDIANVFVVELNENHCVSLENLKPYKTNNDMSMMHTNGHGYNNNIFNPNNIQNVHKLVQSINPQFSKIFINTDNKRRNVKKKQFSMKKSSSFHAFSTELPTLIEVEEQLTEDPFHYGHPYYGHPQNHPIYPIHQQQHSMPHQFGSTYHNGQNNSGSNGMNNQFNYLNHTNNNTYSSLPHTQIFNEFSIDSNNKNKLTNSLSASNINQFNNSVGHLNSNNINNGSMNNKNRRQRFTQNNGMNLNFNGPFNNAMKQPWPNNFQSGPMGPHGFLPPPQLLHHQMSGPQHIANQPFNGNIGPLGPQPLGLNQGFMQPPSVGQMHPSNGPMQPPFIHQGPLPQIPMPPLNHPAQHGPGHRPNLFNPISSFMFGPPPQAPLQGPSSHLPHNQHQADHNNNYYFSNANNNNSLQANQTSQNKNNTQLQSNNQRGRNDKNNNSENFLNNSNSTSNNGKQSTHNGYQQVPQQLQSSQGSNSSTSNTGLLNMPPPTTTVSSELQHPTQTLPNTSNYLLMPAPQINNTSNNNNSSLLQTQNSNSSTIVPPAQTNQNNYNSTSGITRSNSYHSGVSAQAYEVSSSNSSNVYVDVYQPQINEHNNNNNNNASTNGSNNTTNNVPNILPGTVNQHNLIQQSNNSSTNLNGNGSNLVTNTNTNYGANSNNVIGLENSSLGYGNNNFQNYDGQYQRFENNGFNSNQNGLIEENLTTESRSNLWNKSNKLTKDMVYTENSTANNNNNQTSVFPNQNNSQYYSNCFVVNIDGPINFNATHSLLDDGSDLPINDVNTIRFFYNLGIEYYRLNLATPYNQTQNYYQAANTATTTTNSVTSNQIANNTVSTNQGQLISSTSNSSLSTSLNNTAAKLKEDVNIQQTVTNTTNSGTTHQQVVPQQTSLSKPLIQHPYTSRRVVH